MHITRSFMLNVPADEIVSALLSPEMAAKRMALLGVTEFDHKAEGNTAVTRAKVPADKLPSQARAFVKNGVDATVTAVAAGTTVDYSLDLKGAPVDLSWTITLNGDTPTAGDVDGEFKVKIPIMGSKIEQKGAAWVDRLLGAEVRNIEEVVAGN
ncbi:MAG: DUF2505 domain-containing protein [Ancrocorticia sp.]|uniref:DUF2505 domain-containing protein n=2 Tax=Ancrocorticia sp. TaxID=2593684 RepID=UPI003F9230BF